MKIRQIVAMGLAFGMATAVMPSGVSAGAQQAAITGTTQGVTISGTAKKEAKKPYIEFTTRARNTMGGQIAGTVMLDQDANFSLTGLPPANYVVELLNKDGKVVCTEGPFNLTQQFIKDKVDISCNKVPVAWWLLGAAAAAGITAGVVIANASPSQ
jgi:hypothetical protein